MTRRTFQTWQFMWNYDSTWGWDVQIFPNHLEIGKVSQRPEGHRYWYIEWRFRGEWKGWDQFKLP